MLYKTQFTIITGLLFVCMVITCKKDKTFDNPYDDPSLNAPDEQDLPIPLDPTTIQGLHQNIFSPICANAACHDGLFEPDFRTIESSYNTLVYHRNSQKGDSLGFNYRVVPGDTAASFMHERITVDIQYDPSDPSSIYGEGIMPLYSTLSAEDIQNIETWILNGAKDMFGNTYSLVNTEPQLTGVIAFKTGNTTKYARSLNNGPIQIPTNDQSVDIWFSFIDDITPTQDLTINQVKFSTYINNFNGLPLSLNIVPFISDTGYFGDPPGYYPTIVDYHHKITVNPNSFGTVGDIVYMRVYVQDQHHINTTETPAIGAAPAIKQYCAFEIIN